MKALDTYNISLPRVVVMLPVGTAGMQKKKPGHGTCTHPFLVDAGRRLFNHEQYKMYVVIFRCVSKK